MKVILDRFEGNSAIVEIPGQKMVAAPAVLFEGAKEGDVVSILPDPAETQARKAQIEKMMKGVMVDQ